MYYFYFSKILRSSNLFLPLSRDFFLKFAEIRSNQHFILDDKHFLHFYISLFIYFFISLSLNFFISSFLYFFTSLFLFFFTSLYLYFFTSFLLYFFISFLLFFYFYIITLQARAKQRLCLHP